MYITKEHTDIINSIDGMGGNTVSCGAPEIVTGSRDGKVINHFYLLYTCHLYLAVIDDQPLINLACIPYFIQIRILIRKYSKNT